MLKRLIVAIGFVLILSSIALGQNVNSSQTVRPRTTSTPSNTNKATTTDSQRSTDVQEPKTAQPAARPTPTKPRVVKSDAPGSESVVAAFNALVNGIRRADVKAVSNTYWNSPRLLLFNNNGTVTKGWEQMRKNRESSYREMKDVKLDVRELAITMIGRDGAVVTCLWTQSQTFKGEPETATGRMTLVFRRIGKDWKAVHLHTSPDRPDPSRVLPSEQASPTP
jgi:ketosteroid isomerase-like protein